MLGETLKSLLPSTAALDRSLSVATYPAELTRADLDARRIAPGTHWVTHKVDGENFMLVYMPPSIASALEQQQQQQQSRVGQKRAAAAATTATNECSAGIVFLIGRGDVAGTNERTYRLLESTTLTFMTRTRGTRTVLDLPLVYDGELARRRVFSADERAAERERTCALYAWSATPATEHERTLQLDAGIERRHSLVYVVADCLYAGSAVVGTRLLQLRAAACKASLLGTDPAHPPPVVCGTPSRFELVYKPHQPGYDMGMLVRDVAEPALVGCSLDGFILTPKDASFRVGNDPLLFKLKPPALKTLDLRVQPLPNGTHARMFTCAHGACMRSPCDAHAVGECTLAAFERVNIDTRSPTFANAIVEFSPEYAAASPDDRRAGRFAWRPVRLRRDKERPNARRTIESTFAALRNAVTYEEVVAALARPDGARPNDVPMPEHS